MHAGGLWGRHPYAYRTADAGQTWIASPQQLLTPVDFVNGTTGFYFVFDQKQEALHAIHNDIRWRRLVGGQERSVSREIRERLPVHRRRDGICESIQLSGGLGHRRWWQDLEPAAPLQIGGQ